jgi:lysozyme family protein
VTCPHRKTLELGDRGRAVAQLQRALGLVADGVFGPRTLRAVRSLQKHAALAVDGVAGPRTRAVLRVARERSVLERGDTGPAVACLQRSLRISADGVFGRQTQRAVRAFQRARGLTADGIVGPMTRAALGGIDRRLLNALALADRMRLTLVSSHRPGAVIESSGRRSDHAFFPSRAIDIAGPARAMKRYARAVAGMDGVETIIHSPIGIWAPGRGWHDIRTRITYETHFDHVHVDTF